MSWFKTLSLTTLALFTLGNQALALNCPDVKKAPKCPSSGSTLLDDTYPVQAYVVSNAPFIKGGPSAENVTRDFILNIYNSYDAKETPEVILPLDTIEEFNAVKENLRKSLVEKKVNEEEINLRLSKLKHYEAPSYTWQQDWFESFINPKTGRPVLRQMQSYDRGTNSTTATHAMAKLSQCEVSGGNELIADYPTNEEITAYNEGKDQYSENVPGRSFNSGEMGGNIEGAPGGLCLLGDNIGKNLQYEICGNSDNVIEIKTSWLRVGHVDEIFKILPTNYEDGRPKECQFSLMVASPRKALELLNDSSNKSRKFFESTPTYFDKNKQALSDELRARNSMNLCLKYDEAVRQKMDRMNPEKLLGPAGTKSVFIKQLYRALMLQAQLKDIPGDGRGIKFKEEYDRYQKQVEAEYQRQLKALDTCKDNYKEIVNHEMLEIVNKDKEIQELNALIQESIDKDVAETKKQILSRLPQCGKYFNVLEAPSLFEGQGMTINPKTGKKELLRGGTVDSILPNPTNGVVMNKNYLISDSENGVFNDYIENELKKRKMKMTKINTWEYSHLGKGNMHCSSHSIPYCQP